MKREEAVTILRNEQPHCGDKIAFSEAEKYEALNMAIEALKQESKQGKWEHYLKEGLKWKCSGCGSRYTVPWSYCPNCGARMESDGQ